MNEPLSLALASSSPWRRELLARLGLPFRWAAPDIDESPRADETGPALVERLARQKARALADRFPDHLIIGSDQVATLGDGTILGKPGNHENACRQLARCSGQTVTFHTGLALHDTLKQTTASTREIYRVQFRQLTDQDIHQYLSIEQPYQCAGSFRMEGLGIALFEALEGRDPNTLIGLPLIALVDMLKDKGVNVLDRRA
ncbi:MAG: Maf family protein [Marinobacter sp.]